MEELKKQEKNWYVKHTEVESKKCYISGPSGYPAANIAIILFKLSLVFRGGEDLISVQSEPEYIEEGDIPNITEKIERSEEGENVKMYLLKKSDNN